MYRCSSHDKLVETGCKGKNVPANELNEWVWSEGVWSEVKRVLYDPSIIEKELKRLKRRGPDPQTTRSLESAKRQLSKIERGLHVLVGRVKESIENEDLWPIVQREVENASQEKRQIEARIEQLKEQLAEQQNAVHDLRSLKEYCRTIKRQLDRFSFDDKRLAFRALGLAVIVTGRDKSGWRLDISVPTRDERTTKSAQKSTVYGHPKWSESLPSNPSRALVSLPRGRDPRPARTGRQTTTKVSITAVSRSTAESANQSSRSSGTPKSGSVLFD